MERIDLAESPHRLHRLWARGRQDEPGHALIGLGRLETGRWFVAKAERGTNMAWLADDERHACEVVQRWIAQRGQDAWGEVSSETAARPAL